MYIGQEYEIHINAYEFGILKKKGRARCIYFRQSKYRDLVIRLKLTIDHLKWDRTFVVHYQLSIHTICPLFGGGLVSELSGGGWSDLMCDNQGKTDGFIRSLLHSCIYIIPRQSRHGQIVVSEGDFFYTHTHVVHGNLFTNFLCMGMF